MLFVDSDILLPPMTLKYMVEGAPDICLGLYPKKNNTEGLAEIFKLGTSDFTNLYRYEELPADSKIEVKGFGTNYSSTRFKPCLSYTYVSGLVTKQRLMLCCLYWFPLHFGEPGNGE